jgi:hypothetical protein
MLPKTSASGKDDLIMPYIRLLMAEMFDQGNVEYL